MTTTVLTKNKNIVNIYSDTQLTIVNESVSYDQLVALGKNPEFAVAVQRIMNQPFFRHQDEWLSVENGKGFILPNPIKLDGINPNLDGHIIEAIGLAGCMTLIGEIYYAFTADDSIFPDIATRLSYIASCCSQQCQLTGDFGHSLVEIVMATNSDYGLLFKITDREFNWTLQVVDLNENDIIIGTGVLQFIGGPVTEEMVFSPMTGIFKKFDLSIEEIMLIGSQDKYTNDKIVRIY